MGAVACAPSFFGRERLACLQPLYAVRVNVKLKDEPERASRVPAILERGRARGATRLLIHQTSVALLLAIIHR